jgi:hypothetical protein
MHIQQAIGAGVLISWALGFPVVLFADPTPTYTINQYVINAAGNTYSGTGRELYDSMGEAVVGSALGQQYKLTSGFFNEYFLLPPTPTITPTIIRTFDHAIMNENYIYAAPHPMRGHVGHIVFDISVSAEVTLKIYTITHQLVLSKQWDTLPAGTNRWDWENGNMANGVYLLWIKARGVDGRTTSITKKIALMH